MSKLIGSNILSARLQKYQAFLEDYLNFFLERLSRESINNNNHISFPFQNFFFNILPPTCVLCRKTFS